jgi:hypothetical protein
MASTIRSDKSPFLVWFLVRRIVACEIETCSKIFAVAISMTLECLDNCVCSFCEGRPIFLDASKHTIKVGVLYGWGILQCTSENTLQITLVQNNSPGGDLTSTLSPSRS